MKHCAGRVQGECRRQAARFRGYGRRGDDLVRGGALHGRGGADGGEALTEPAPKVFIFHFHDLRHTFASRLADAGVDAFTITELMGHSTLEMTKRYTHVTDERKRNAVAALGQKGKAGEVVTIWSQKQKRQAG